MSIQLVIEQEIRVGEAVVIEGPAPEGYFLAVFEDDGDTGYFYAVDTSLPENEIQDALHIYNVANVSDREKPSQVRIGWSQDSAKVLLLINGYPHAVFDFKARQGYCRTGFPPAPANGSWSVGGHEWNDMAIGLFV